MSGRNVCKHCGLMMVEAYGSPNASILIIGDAPNFDEVRSGRVGDGKMGDILRKELALAGIQMSSCRIINLWPHAKSKECDVEYHKQALLRELEGREWVLLTGTEVSKELLGHSIMEITGLQVKSKLFPKVKFFGIPNAGTLLHGDVGEMRLALEKLIEKRRRK